MNRSSSIFSLVALLLTIAVTSTAGAAPVVYTLRTVADGKIGNHVFGEALVTIQMKSDTRSVRAVTRTDGSVFYENRNGTAVVSITDNSGRTTVATFVPGEVYVRYDPAKGIAGFGSSISPTYPIALGCDNFAYPSDAYAQDCLVGDWRDTWNNFANGTANALADPTFVSQPNPDGYTDRVYSAALLALPMSLTKSTLLTGRAHSCATVYTVGDDYGFFFDGDLQVCAARASRGLRTDRGGFYLQDQVGGSTNCNVEHCDYYQWGGWDAANTGSLQVEVLGDR
jgi:hypothetical protein